MATISFQILDLTCHFSLEDNKTVAVNYHYNMAYMIGSDQLPEASEWEFMENYASHIYTFPCVESFGERRYFIYSDTQEVRDYYKYNIDVHEGECLINGERLTELNDDFDNGFVYDESTRYVILHKNDYEKIKEVGELQNVIFVFDSFEQKNNMLKSVSQELSDVLRKNTISIDNTNYTLMYNQYLNSQNEVEMNIKPYIFITGLIIMYIFLFSLETLHHKEDIGTYQLMGVLSKEIKLIYFYKSLIIAFLGFVSGGFWYMLSYYSIIRAKNIVQYLVIPPVITCFVIIIVVILSMISLHFVLKRDAFDNKMTRD